MKTCTDCNESKPTYSFYHRDTYCKDCRKAKVRERYRNSPKVREATMRRNRQVLAAMTDEERYRHKRDAYLWTQFRIRLADYDAMYECQTGACATCGLGDQELVVDHCHATGVVRGLLCRNCNLAVGHVKDDPVRARAIADYLERSVHAES